VRPRIVLADDHVIVAEGLGRLVAEIAELVDQVNDGRSLVESVRKHRPDLVVSDVSMPGMSGLEAMRVLRAEGCMTKFIFLTVHGEGRLAAEAFRAGASGYLLKEAAGDELRSAIRAVMADRTYLTPLITREVLSTVAGGGDAQTLTQRQREVLKLIAAGKQMKEIAAELGLSVRTVEDHKAELKRVLDLKTTAELVRFALERAIG